MIQGLTPDRQNADPATQRVSYAPVVLTVGAPSKYPDAATQLPKGCAFVEIDGFWDWHKNDLLAGNIPKSGEVVMVRLSTNPKQTAGSFYQDIQKWKPALETEFPIPTQRGGQQGGDLGWGTPAPQQPAAGVVQPVGSGLTLDQRIAKGMAFNNLTTALANPKNFFNEETLVPSMNLWQEAFEDAMNGDTPFNRTEEPVAHEPEQESGMPPEVPDDDFETVSW